ncbi:hypothetical protein [Methylocaldum szegediense]|jgi:hypothetical protein|nr:hypothetical protein [Methylocaldum szegediense]
MQSGTSSDSVRPILLSGVLTAVFSLLSYAALAWKLRQHAAQA